MSQARIKDIFASCHYIQENGPRDGACGYNLTVLFEGTDRLPTGIMTSIMGALEQAGIKFHGAKQEPNRITLQNITGPEIVDDPEYVCDTLSYLERLCRQLIVTSPANVSRGQSALEPSGQVICQAWLKHLHDEGDGKNTKDTFSLVFAPDRIGKSLDEQAQAAHNAVEEIRATLRELGISSQEVVEGPRLIEFRGVTSANAGTDPVNDRQYFSDVARCVRTTVNAYSGRG